MNEHGLALLTDYEQGPGGGAALVPYICPGDVLTIGYGCTKWFDGSPVTTEHRLKDDREARQLLAIQLTEYEQAVRDLVTIELTSNQFSALTAFAFNCGIKALAGSTLLREVNAGRHYDAAAAFGMWIFATAGGHKQALRGLLRRRYSEALTYLSYQYQDACADEAIALQREKPETLPGTDRVRYKTPFKEVLAVAQNHPLDASELILTPSMQAAPASKPVAEAAPALTPNPAPETASAQQDPASVSGKAGPLDPTAAPQPPVVPPVPSAKPIPAPVPQKAPVPPVPPPPMPPSVQVNPNNDMGGTIKVMYRSKRFWGGLLIIIGRLIIVLDVTGNFAAPVRAFIGDGVLMDWMTGVIVTMIGEIVMDRGEKKATGPIDTPKRIALTTPAP